MTPKEKIAQLQNSIHELQQQLVDYRKELIRSVVEEPRGHKIILTTQSGSRYLTQKAANGRHGRKVWDLDGNLITVEVRSNMQDVKFYVATLD
jgi:hypothetical protein